MTHKFECEYINKEGGHDYFDVELESECKWKYDAFSHEFGAEKIPPYVSMESYPKWDVDFYTFSENWLIAIWLMANYKSIEKRILKEFEEDCVASTFNQ